MTSHLLRDVRYSLRSLSKSPGFTMSAVATLALGIAAATAIFSVLHAVVLAPLPYREPQQLQVLWEVMEDGALWRVSPAAFAAWRLEARSFEDVAAFGGGSYTRTGLGEPETLRGARVTPNYFELLGVRPLLGRPFGREDGRPGGPRVLALGQAYWESRFGSDPGVMGQTLTLDDQAYTVVAVMPSAPYPAWPKTQGKIAFAPDARVFVPADLEGAGAPGGRSYVLGVVGRLRGGVSAAAAQKEMTALSRQLRAADPRSRAVDVRLAPLPRETAGAAQQALWILFAAVVSVLAIACANVASLQLARAQSRGHEISVRAALGAARGRIATELLVESLLVALAAGLAGTVLVYWALPLLVRLVPPEVPRLAQVQVHRGILAFALAVSTGAGVLSGLAPALLAARRGGAAALSAARGATGSRAARRTLRILVLAETAVALLLAFGAVLLTRSLLRLQGVDPGFRSAGVLIARVALPRRRYDSWQDVARFQGALLERVRALPGVAEAGLAYNHPLEANWIGGGSVAGEAAATGKDSSPSWFRSVSEGYFRAAGIPMLRGRDFSASDDAGHPAVALVNEAFERLHFPGATAIGRYIEATDARSWWGDGLPTRFEIVGVVGDVRFLGPEKPPEPAYYLSARQFPIEDMLLVAKATGDPDPLVPELRRVLHSLDPALPLSDVQTLTGVYRQALAPARLNTRLMVAFGGAALGLAMLGVYGMLSYIVTLRTREIGIRIALGAPGRRVVASVVAETARLAFIGASLGLAGALALSRLLRSVLFGITETDPISLAAATVSLLVVMVLASGLPARRAARIPPIQALKGD